MLLYFIGAIWLLTYLVLGIMLLWAGLRWLFKMFSDKNFEKQELEKYEDRTKRIRREDFCEYDPSINFDPPKNNQERRELIIQLRETRKRINKAFLGTEDYKPDEEKYYWMNDDDWFDFKEDGKLIMTEAAPQKAVESFNKWKEYHNYDENYR